MAAHSNTVASYFRSPVRLDRASRLVWLKRACLILVTTVFLLISLGGLVRNAGAGLSCPDWPLCYGKVVPPMDVKIFLEWFHRLIAGTVSIFLLGISTYVFFQAELRSRVGKYCALAIALLAAQIVLGGMTVLGLLAPKWVYSHLAVGFAFFGTLVWLTLEVSNLSETKVSGRRSKFFWSSALVTFAVYYQAILGAMVSSHYAGLACPDFPTCFGQWIPPLSGIVQFQFFHRVGALTVTVLLSVLLAALFYSYNGPERPNRAYKLLRISMRVIPVLLVLQIVLGIGSVYMQLPILMSVAHLSVAALLFGKLLVMTHAIRRI